MKTIELVTLNRTDDSPVQFSGALIATFHSSNYGAHRYEEIRQWFILTVYKTEGNNWIGWVNYRAGSNLHRERPVDRTFIALSVIALGEMLDDVLPVEEFVTGWPDGGALFNGVDRTSHHRSVCKFAEQQWDDITNQFATRFQTETPQVIA